MLLMQMLLPRFLVLEIVLFFHFIQQGQGKREATSSEEGKTCTLDISNLDSRFPPLFLYKGGSDFLLPYKEDSSSGEQDEQIQLKIEPGDSITATCPGNSLRSPPPPNSNSISYVCSSGDKFSLGDAVVSEADILSKLACSKSIQETVQEVQDSNCGPTDGGGKLVEVGWPPDSSATSKLLTQYSVCHSKSKAHTYYSSHELHGEALSSTNYDGSRPNFKEGRGFFSGASAGNAYSTKTQEETFKQLLGPAAVQQFFSQQKFFLARGHLSPDADFVYKEWQDATYYFFNVAPQWQPFNNGNWKLVESRVREYAESNRKLLNVFTGTYEQLTLPDANGNQVPISLTNKNNQIPVPRLIWKILHDPVTKKNIVFFGVNNPHATVKEIVESGFVLCPDDEDVCSNSNWNFPKKKDYTKGYVYCCSYPKAKSVIEWLPTLEDSGLLVFESPNIRTSPRKRPSRDLTNSQGCVLDLKKGSKIQWPPLFYDEDDNIILPMNIVVENSEGDGLEFDLFYSTHKIIAVNDSDIVTVACPKSKLKFSQNPIARLACVNNSLVSETNPENEIQYSDLSCTKSIQEDLVKKNESCGPAGESGKMVEIGWSLVNSFKSMINLCHDEVVEHTYYAFHQILGNSLSAKDRDHKRPGSFQEGAGFYKKTVANHLYKQKNQEKLFKENGLGEFFNRSEEIFLTGGHLAPNGDFVYKEWQDASFYYLNVAPQWKQFNSGNWLAVEDEVRSHALHHKKTLDVFTGTHGILSLPDVNGDMKEVFLDSRKLIPVPLFYWKLVHDPSLNQAIVFIGVNSPQQFPIIPSNYLLCPDICATFHWHFLFKDVAKKGFLYCCSYQEFQKAVPWVDFLEDPSVLAG